MDGAGVETKVGGGMADPGRAGGGGIHHTGWKRRRAVV